jgi:hypothetical protein
MLTRGRNKGVQQAKNTQFSCRLSYKDMEALDRLLDLCENDEFDSRSNAFRTFLELLDDRILAYLDHKILKYR